MFKVLIQLTTYTQDGHTQTHTLRHRHAPSVPPILINKTLPVSSEALSISQDPSPLGLGCLAHPPNSILVLQEGEALIIVNSGALSGHRVGVCVSPPASVSLNHRDPSRCRQPQGRPDLSSIFIPSPGRPLSCRLSPGRPPAASPHLLITPQADGRHQAPRSKSLFFQGATPLHFNQHNPTKSNHPSHQANTLCLSLRLPGRLHMCVRDLAWLRPT